MAGSNVFPAILRAEYDPSGNAFPALEQAFKQSADRYRQTFTSAFNDVKALAQSALAIPRNAGGSLEIDSASYRRAADDAKALAIAQREIAEAARRVAAANPSEEYRQMAQGASAAARESEELAVAANKTAIAHERLEAELNQAKSATDRLVQSQRSGTTVNGALTNSFRANRQATTQAGQQLQDIVISLGSGQRASTVFAQQLPQLGFAISGASGKFGEFGRFLAGPWGVAVAVGGFALGGLVDKLFTSGDAADKTKNKTITLADAFGKLKIGTDESRKALEEYNSEQDRARKSTEDMIKLNLASAEARLKDALATREQLKARLEAAFRTTGGGPFGGEARTGAAVGEASTALAQNQSSIDLIAKTIGNLRIQDAVRDAKAAVDPIRAINDRYDDMAAAATRAAAGNDTLTKSLKGTLTGYELQRKAAVDAANEANKARTGSTDFTEGTLQSNKLALARFESELNKRGIFKAAGRTTFRTAADQNEIFKQGLTPLDGFKKRSPHQDYRALDPGVGKDNLTGAYAAAAAAGLKGFQIVKESGGRIHYQFKSATTDMQAFQEAEKDAADAAKELARDLDAVLKTFDPATSAAADYADQLATIARLSAAGVISGEQASQFRVAASLNNFDAEQDQFERAMQDTFERLGPKWQDALKTPFETGSDFMQVAEESMRKLAETLGLALSREGEQALNSIADLFGGRVARLLESLSRSARPGDSVNSVLNSVGAGKKEFNDALKNGLNSIFNKVFSSAGPFAKTLGSVLAGAQTGQASATIFQSITGGKSSKAGSQIGGALGEVAGKAIFSKLGAFAGPLGSIVGGILGGVVGGLFKKTPKGTATISNTGVSYTGSGSLKSGLTQLGTGVNSSLAGIADQLGGTVGNYSASITQKKKKFFVNGQKFTDEAEASRAVLLAAINQGAVQGIRQGAQNLLRAGTDIEKQLSKAVKFQDVFKQLKRIKDPIGAALDDLFLEFTTLKSIFTEASASAAEFAQLEELYGLKRAEAIKQATEQFTGALQSLIDDLKTGDNGLSLRDRLSNARALFDPLANDVRAGKTVDYDKFADNARLLIDIQRQLSGSTNDYFATFNEVLGLSQQALAGQQNVVSIASASNSPFTTPTNANTPVVTAINQQTTDLAAYLAAMNGNLGNILGYMQAASGAGGGYRQYAIYNF